jgi:hypothetical protein
MLMVIVVTMAFSVWHMTCGRDGYDGFLGALQEIPGTRLASGGWLPWSDAKYAAKYDAKYNRGCN